MSQKKNSYDEFLHKIQQAKMKELWDNKEDEAWVKITNFFEFAYLICSSSVNPMFPASRHEYALIPLLLSPSVIAMLTSSSEYILISVIEQ